VPKGQKLASLLVAAVAAGLLAASAGYLIGEGGDDQPSAASVPEASASGKKQGVKEGYATGFAIGKRSQFQQSFSTAYRKAFQELFDEAGLQSPSTGAPPAP
jgi:hypothetical protein